MRKLSATFGTLMLAATLVGCVGEVLWEPDHMDEMTGVPPEATTVRGQIAETADNAVPGLAGMGTLASASKVVVSKLEDDGRLTEISVAEVQPGGSFDVAIPNNGSATGMLVVQVKSIADAVLGSTVINGIPAFFREYFIALPLDTATSFKTEILMTIANGGVPGIQNYLNVVNTFVDSTLATTITVFNAFVLDFNAIFGAVAGAVIATEGVIFQALEDAGLPIDTARITSSQLMAVSGVQGLVTTSAGKIVTGTKNLITSLEEAASAAAAPLDAALFNALMSGGAIFNSTAKAKMLGKPEQDALSFALQKASFKVQSATARDRIDGMFKQAGVSGDAMVMVAAASAAFASEVDQAKDPQALAAAAAKYNDALLGKQTNANGSVLEKIATFFNNILALITNVKSMMDPLSANLRTALSGTALTSGGVMTAVAKFDDGARDLASKLQANTTATNAKVLAESLKMTGKLVVP